MKPAGRHLLVFAGFTALAAFCTWPLLGQAGSRIALNTGDPALNTTILWWNATVLPFTAAWWNPPWFFPAHGMAALTENLVGIAPIATPVYWLTHNPVAAYNVAFFLSWPLSAFGAYWLTHRITGRTDAAIITGFAFGFAPYRASAEIGHLQSLSAYWLPVALAALHAYLDTSRARWLALFAAAWLLQSLANGYYLLFGAVLIALWLVYFGSTARTRRAAMTAAIVWIAASLPLVPLLLAYARIHEYYGLHRTMAETMAFSAQAQSWLQVSPLIRTWAHILPSGKDTLFPGLTIVALTAVGLAMLARSRAGVAASAPRSARSPFVFYAVAAVLMAIFACGPVLRASDRVLIDPAPYRWLMALPGFDELRVPSRFWMMGALCLAVAAGLAFHAIAGGRRSRNVWCAAISVLVLADGWFTSMPMARIPPAWEAMTGADPRLPLLDLPLGPLWDNAAAFRVTAHGRRVMNGVSGYDPPHYAALSSGLQARDPAMLAAIATLGSFEIVIESGADRDGAWKRYATGAEGARVVAEDWARTIVRVPAAQSPEPSLGEPLTPIAVQRNADEQWVMGDLAREQTVGGVSLVLAPYGSDFPRSLIIEASPDGEHFTEAWSGTTSALAFLAILKSPSTPVIPIAIPVQQARYIRVRRPSEARTAWTGADIYVHAPFRKSS